MAETNDYIVLVGGPSKAGKSTSLRNLRDPEGVMFLNCEANKKLPFTPVKFQCYKIIDPFQVYEGIEYAEKVNDFHTIIIDTATYLMNMYYSKYVHNSKNGMKAWADYGQFFRNLMQDYAARSSKNIIVLAHTEKIMNEEAMIMEVKVPIKGALKAEGVESYFTTIVAAKTQPLISLTNYSNDLLKITKEEEIEGQKHVFQTKLTKDSINERISSSLGMWDIKETFIDNDIQLVLDRLHQYYGPATAAA